MHISGFNNEITSSSVVVVVVVNMPFEIEAFYLMKLLKCLLVVLPSIGAKNGKNSN